MSLVTRVQYQARVEHEQHKTLATKQWCEITQRTPQEYCELLKRLDIQFKTTKASPLHHDNRCGLDHKEGIL